MPKGQTIPILFYSELLASGNRPGQVVAPYHRLGCFPNHQFVGSISNVVCQRLSQFRSLNDWRLGFRNSGFGWCCYSVGSLLLPCRRSAGLDIGGRDFLVRRLHWNLTWFIACQLALLASSAKLTLLRKSGADKQLNKDKYQAEVKLVLIYKGEDFSIRKSR